ncbi:hypothetical protein HY091_02160 [Candidatus Kaiserbacteria bacterium]|nr:hypothetical protein [Candidatus Kaiserbacteria bacterium]
MLEFLGQGRVARAPHSIVSQEELDTAAEREEERDDLERGPETAHMLKLHQFSPEAAKLVGVLQQNEPLTNDAFLQKIATHNATHESAIPVEERIGEKFKEEFTLAAGSGRSVIVRIFDNGRVELTGVVQ